MCQALPQALGNGTTQNILRFIPFVSLFLVRGGKQELSKYLGCYMSAVRGGKTEKA